MSTIRLKHGFVTTGDFDSEKYPCPPVPIEPSSTECRHTPVPALYHDWYEWCERASKTHSSVQCPCCGLWSIWLPKKLAAAINKRKRAEDREVIKTVKRQMAIEYRKKAKAIPGNPYTKPPK